MFRLDQIWRLFRSRDVVRSIIINGDNSGTVTLQIGGTARPPELSLQWTPLQKNISGLDSSNIFDLLSWRSRLIERMIGRDLDYAQLIAWACEAPNQIAIRFLTGPGGAGKSRLAAEVATELRKKKWSTGFINLNKRVEIPVTQMGTLLVIDYPEERREDLRGLLREIRGMDNPPGKIRVLLLSRRPRDWWNADLVASGAHELCDAQDCTVKPLDAADTCQLVREAVGRLAAYRSAAPVFPEDAAIFSWHARNPDLHGLPLFVTAAAIHSVLEPASTFDLSGAKIVEALVRRERRRLDEAARRAHWPVPEAASRLYGLASLRGGLEGGTLKSLAQRAPDIGLPPAERIVDQVRDQGWWTADHLPAPQPDLMAAELLHQILGEQSDAVADWLSAVLDSARSIDVGRLARLAHDIATLHAGPSNRLVSGLIAAVKKHPDIAVSWQEFLHSDKISFRLSSLGVVIGETLLRQDRVDDAQRGAIFNNLANRLSETGDRQGALEPAKRAVDIYQTLARDNPAAYLPYLAISLKTLKLIQDHISP